VGNIFPMTSSSRRRAARLFADFAPEPGHVRERVVGMLRILGVNVVAPLTTLAISQARGVPLVPALAISAVFPAGEFILTRVRDRHVDALALVSFALIALGAVTSVIGNDVRFALVKESAVSVVFGALCLGSLLQPKPLMYYLGREFFSGGEPHRMAAWELRWRAQGFRSALRRITAVWAVGSLLEAVLRVGLVFALTPAVMIFLSPFLAVVATVALIAWSVLYWLRTQEFPAEER
jgi:hypothetical protein